MIDMTLLQEPWHTGFVPICAVQEGTSCHLRGTLELGDMLYQREPPNARQLVGRDVTVAQLYPDLWSDWHWEDQP